MKKLLISLSIAVTALGARAQVVAIPDTFFLKALIAKGVDTNKNGKIETSEALAVTKLDVGYSIIFDLTGIAAFTNLDTLDCTLNHLTTLDVSKNTQLVFLNCSFNKLSTLDLSKNVALKNLSCQENKIKSLNLNLNSKLSKTDYDGSVTLIGATAREEEVLLYAEQMPSFPGGYNAMQQFIVQHIVYPEKAQKMGIEGKVYVEFIVNKDGSLSNILVKRGIGHGCDEAVIDLVRSMPKWEPARVSGRPERLKTSIPIIFKLTDNTPPKSDK
jgi:TonB family protein